MYTIKWETWNLKKSTKTYLACHCNNYFNKNLITRQNIWATCNKLLYWGLNWPFCANIIQRLTIHRLLKKKNGGSLCPKVANLFDIVNGLQMWRLPHSLAVHRVGEQAFSPFFRYHRKDHSVSVTSTNIYTNWLFGTVEKSIKHFFHSSINGVHNRSDFLLFCVTTVVGREFFFDYDVFRRLRWGPRGGLCWLARARNASAMRWGWFCIRVFQPGVSITSVAWL